MANPCRVQVGPKRVKSLEQIFQDEALDTNHKAKKWWRFCKENIRAPGFLSAESGFPFFRRLHKYRVFQASYPTVTVTWMCIPVAMSGCYVGKHHIANWLWWDRTQVYVCILLILLYSISIHNYCLHYINGSMTQWPLSNWDAPPMIHRLDLFPVSVSPSCWNPR